MIFEGRGFVNLQTSSLCTSGFEALFTLKHVKTSEISPTLNERMTYKVFGRQGLACLVDHFMHRVMEGQNLNQ